MASLISRSEPHGFFDVEYSGEKDLLVKSPKYWGSKKQIEGLLGRNFRRNRAYFMQLSSWQIKTCSKSRRRIYWKLNIYSISYVPNCNSCTIFVFSSSLAYLLSYYKHLSTLGLITQYKCEWSLNKISRFIHYVPFSQIKWTPLLLSNFSLHLFKKRPILGALKKKHYIRTGQVPVLGISNLRIRICII